MARGPTLLTANGRWPADIDVWHTEITYETSDLRPMLDQLQENERLVADRFRVQADRARFIVARWTLRSLLSTCVKVAPELLRVVNGLNGRPLLDGYPNLSFNVTHSGAHALIAISGARTVGIDIEVFDAGVDWCQLAEFVCTEVELRAIEQSAPWLQNHKFLRCWTAKESMLKAWGIGIAGGLRSITVDLGERCSQRPVLRCNSAVAAGEPLRFHWLSDIPGCIGCIAYGEERT